MKPQFTITEALVSNDPRWIVVRCDWIEDVAAQFSAIANLPNGWDGDAAASPDLRSLEAAWRLIASLCCADGMTRPHVNPTRCGGVQLEWENGPRYFEIEVVAERAATYLYRDSDSSVEDAGEVFEGESLHRIIQYIMLVEADASRGSPRQSKPACECESVEAVA